MNIPIYEYSQANSETLLFYFDDENAGFTIRPIYNKIIKSPFCFTVGWLNMIRITKTVPIRPSLTDKIALVIVICTEHVLKPRPLAYHLKIIDIQNNN